MTKKSYARQTRDAQEKNLKGNTSWDDLNQIQAACLSTLQTHAVLGNQLLDPTLAPFYRDAKSVTINMRTMASDMDRLSKSYVTTSAKHQGRSGGSTDNNDLMESLKLAGEYAALHEDMNNTLAPSSIYLAEELGYAVQAREEAARTNMTPEQDPSVISDVEVKAVEA